MATAQQMRDRLRDHFDAAIMQTYAKTMLRGYPVPDDLYGPFVPHIYDEYASSKSRLLVVGQQTNGWQPFSEALRDRLLFRDLEKYTEGFKQAEGYYASPFWDFAYKLAQSLGETSPLAFVWTNLAKLEQDNGLPAGSFLQFVRTEFCILSREIESIDAQAVVFLTGPNYDELLLSQIYMSSDPKPDTFVPVKGYELPHLAQLSELPYRAYRCYHPNYLRRQGTFDATLRSLSELIKQR